MGRLASGARLRTFWGAGVVLLGASVSFAQVPALPAPAPSQAPAGPPPAGEALPPQPPPPPPPPAAEPTPPPAPAAKPRPAPPAQPEAPPPLDPPPAPEAPPKRPAFLHTAEEMDRLKPLGSRVERAPLPEPTPPASALPEDFVLRSSPWVDFTLTSFHLEDRTGNFFNLGVQVGGYVFERLRVSARLATPLEDVSDGYSSYADALPSNGSQSFDRVKARSLTLLYGASVGLLITNSKTFAFGPSVQLLRTDVSAYGTALSIGLPFEWTTRKNLRIGFEFALGHAFGGNIKDVCRTVSTPSTSCGTTTRDRPAGTAVLFQYNMGWALGRL